MVRRTAVLILIGAVLAATLPAAEGRDETPFAVRIGDATLSHGAASGHLEGAGHATRAGASTCCRSAPPARAALAVTALPRPAALVEVKCSARIRKR